MNPVTHIAIYIVIWWVVLFAVLPFGVRSQLEADDIVEGTEPGAPVRSHLWLKFLATTLIAALLWGAFYYAYRHDVFGVAPPGWR